MTNHPLAAKILITGANGYIGRRLIVSLLSEGHTVYAMVRDVNRCRDWHILPEHKPCFHLIQGDVTKPASLEVIPKDIDAVYYLIHSMSDSPEFVELEKRGSANFASAVSKTQARQIIYLGGISNAKHLSTHLKSRHAVESELSRSGIPLTVLRAAIIIGSGSASFEIIRDLVEKLPIMITPKWLNTRCQPIAVRDALIYLCGVLLKEKTYGKIFDIGGPDILTYKEMLLELARYRKVKRLIVTLPVLTPRLSSLWLTLVTSVPQSLARSLVDSLTNEVIVKNEGIHSIVQHKPMTYSQALALAFEKIQSNNVLSNWSDGQGRADLLSSNRLFVPHEGCYKDIRKAPINDGVKKTIDRIFSIGGQQGWCHGEWLWELRGLLDKCVGGVGLRRGRRNPNELESGDVLDFWRVLIANREEGRLLLYAEMKLPGEAWLEFKCIREDDKDLLLQVATFRPVGLFGRLYWFSVLPFHAWIFPGLARKLAGNL